MGQMTLLQTNGLNVSSISSEVARLRHVYIFRQPTQLRSVTSRLFWQIQPMVSSTLIIIINIFLSLSFWLSFWLSLSGQFYVMGNPSDVLGSVGQRQSNKADKMGNRRATHNEVERRRRQAQYFPKLVLYTRTVHSWPSPKLAFLLWTWTWALHHLNKFGHI